MRPEVDIVVLSAKEGPLDPRVERGIAAQTEVLTQLHRVVAAPRPSDRHRRETIARGRNAGLERGRAPWLLFLDDDVEIGPGCVAELLAGLEQRPIYGALAADYLGESARGAVAGHVGMGATLFR